MEVIKDCRKYIIGGIYRHPSSNINNFTEKMDNNLALISKQKLSCLIAGDINIDLKKLPHTFRHKSLFRYSNFK